MNISEADLKAKCQEMDTLELLDMSQSSELTALGQQITEQVLTDRKASDVPNQTMHQETSNHRLFQNADSVLTSSSETSTEEKNVERPGPRQWVLGKLSDNDNSSIERLALERPNLYRFRLIFLALIGYAYVITIAILYLGLSFGLIAAMFALKTFVFFNVAIPVLVLAVITLKSLWVSFRPPEGYKVTKKSAPLLYAEIQKLRALTGAKRIHEVLINSELNAGVTEIPRFSIFAGYRRYLVLGFPLLLCLSVEQVQSVLTHEFGHLSRKHCALANWAYRVRRVWLGIFTSLNSQQGGGIFRWFFRWYGPLFARYSFTLARQSEYEADRSSVLAVGPNAAGSALISIEVAARFYDSAFLEKLLATAREQDQLPAKLIACFHEEFKSFCAKDYLVKAYMEDFLQVPTGNHDTHPSLSDRLNAIGYDRQWLPNLETPSAAKVLLPELISELSNSNDLLWQVRLKPQWEAARQRFYNARTLVKRFESGSEEQSKTLDESFIYAQALDFLGEHQKSRQVFDEILDAHPRFVPALFHRGKSSLRVGDAAGIADLEAAMESDVDATPNACAVLYNYLNEQGLPERYEPFRGRLEVFRHTRLIWVKERTSFSAQDQIIPHGFTQVQQETWKYALEEFSYLSTVWIARKNCRMNPEDLCYVIVIRFSRGMVIHPQIHNEILSVLPTKASCILLDYKLNQKVTEKLRRMPGTKFISA